MDVELRDVTIEDLGQVCQLLEMSCEHDRAAAVAEETVFGPGAGGRRPTALGAWQDDMLVGLVVSAGAWIRLLAVLPHIRGKGIGTVLLAGAESDIRRAEHTVVRVLDEPGNYLAPGISRNNQEVIAWLEKRGYQRCGNNESLLIDVVGNPRLAAGLLEVATKRCTDAGYVIRRATDSDRPMLESHIAELFSPAWAFEIARAMDFEPAGVHVAVKDGELAAFAAHDGNNAGLGWFGPAGTHPDHRRKGLGEVLLRRCLADVASAGHDQCTISWIGPRAFYDRVAGIASDLHYVAMRKELLKP